MRSAPVPIGTDGTECLGSENGDNRANVTVGIVSGIRPNLFAFGPTDDVAPLALLMATPSMKVTPFLSSKARLTLLAVTAPMVQIATLTPLANEFITIEKEASVRLAVLKMHRPEQTPLIPTPDRRHDDRYTVLIV